MHQNLINHIQKYILLDENDIVSVQTNFKPLLLKNKHYLLNEGHVCKSLYFVANGCLRMFFCNDKGSEQIIQFAIEDWWMTDYFSFSDQQQSNFAIQAIEPSVVLAIDHTSYDKLLNEIPQMERYFRIMAQRAVGASQVRQKLAIDLSKEDLYLHFNSSFPQFTQRIPQYMLASFLGISPEYLSELRKKHS